MLTIGRPREFDRDAALDAAMLLFWRKGYAATSMNDLCEAMGIRSPSLYAAFDSKETLYREALERYVATYARGMWDKLSEGPTARVAVRKLLTEATRSLPQSATSPPGCMVMLAAVADEWPAPITEDVRKIRRETLRMLRVRLKTAVAQGELAASTDIDRLSRFYVGVYQGMAIQARDGATADQLEDIAETAMMAWPGKK